MPLLHKPLTEEEARAGRQSVAALDDALAERFANLSNPRLIAWASDLHLHAEGGYPFEVGYAYGYVDSSRQFELCLHEINALKWRPDALIFGGDITDVTHPQDWLEFKRIMDKGICELQTFPLLGNHDNMGKPLSEEVFALWPKISLAGWPQMADPNELYYSVVVNGVKYILLDSIHRADRKMSENQLAWLEAELKQTSQPTLIFLHVHVLPVGNWLDEAGPYRSKEMLDLIHGSPHVLGIFSGHVHMPTLWQYRRKYYGTFPSVAYGIGGSTGWGGIVLDDSGIVGVFYKELVGESYDDCTGLHDQQGKFEFMEPKMFQKHPMLNPFFFFRESDVERRD